MMESQAVEELKAQVARLERERDHWKIKAEEQPETTPGNENSIHAIDPKLSENSMDQNRNLVTGRDDPEEDVKEASIPGGNSPLPKIYPLATPKSTPVDITPAESGLEALVIPPVVSDESKSDDNAELEAPNAINTPGPPGDMSIIDTYQFMDDFPNGEWWTRLDEEDGPFRSLDFGVDGCTASLNIGHELLQMTTPHSHFGLSYARGSFADNPDAILARAQRTVGGKSTFGLKWLQGPMAGQGPGAPPTPYYRRGPLQYHGLLNFRWPYKKHTMYRAGIINSSVASLSFVKDHMVYQILRFDPGNSVPPPPQIPQSSAPLKSRKVSGESRNPSTVAPRIPLPPPPPPFINTSKPTVNVQIGGTVRLGFSSSSNEPSGYSVKYHCDTISLSRPEEDQTLDMQLFVNGRISTPPVHINDKSGDLDEFQVLVKRVVTLELGKPTVVVARSALRSGSVDASRLPLPTNEELAQYLGAEMSSENATDRVWGSRIDLNADIDDDDFCASASCLEQILGVTSVPMRLIANPVQPPPPAPLWRPLIATSSAQVENKTVSTNEELVSLAKTPNLANLVGNERQSLGQSEAKNVETVVLSTPATNSVSTDSTRDPSIVESQVSAPKQTSVPNGKRGSNGDHADAQSRHSIASDLPGGEGPSSEFNRHITTPKTPQSTSGQPQPLSESAEIRPSPSSPTQPKPPHSSFFPAQTQEASIGMDTPQSRPSLIPPLSSLPARGLGIDDPDMGVALLCGILGNQYVDLQKSFWQIRYLVKAYNFLAIREKSPSNEPTDTDRNSSSFEDLASLERVRTSYLNRIKFHIHHALVWLARAKVKCGNHCSPAAAPYKFHDSHGDLEIKDPDYDRVLYPPIAIWYVIQNCEEALPRSFMITLAAQFHDLRDQDIGDVDITKSDHDPKLAILMWYRYSCLTQIDQALSKYPDLHEIPRVMNGIASKP